MSNEQQNPRKSSERNPNEKQPSPSDTKQRDGKGNPIQNDLQVRAKNSDKKS
jgi:hypothetical protein